MRDTKHDLQGKIGRSDLFILKKIKDNIIFKTERWPYRGKELPVFHHLY